MSEGVIIAIITHIAGVLMLWIKLRAMHKQFNSRMDQMLIDREAIGKAQGKIEGKAEEAKESKIRKESKQQKQ